MNITLAQLRTISGNPGLSDEICNAVNHTLTRWKITDKWETCAFLANIVHESGGLRVFSENLNYSAERLLVVFPKYFKTQAEATAYGRQPQKIANRVYASRMGNGDEASGDGYRYRGRGAIQLTGHNNYRDYGKAAGFDALAYPDRLAEPEHAIGSAGWFWVDRGVKLIAQRSDINAVTRAVNGGLNGIDDRKRVLDLALKTL